MLVVTRHRVADEDPSSFLTSARQALAVLGARPGFLAGTIGRAADDPGLWVVTTRWVHVGAYRRALSAYDVKVHAIPLLSTAVDEPTAFEILAEVGPGAGGADSPGTGRSDRAADAGSVGLGRASGPTVPSDLPG